MKTAAKVFIVFGIIFGFYLIYPLIIGIMALKKINRRASKYELQNFGIITLLFCNFLGGLFMLFIDEERSNKPCEDRVIVKYEKVKRHNDNELRQLNGGASAKITRVCVWCLVAISLICFTLSIFNILFPGYSVHDYPGEFYFIYSTGVAAAFLTDAPVWIFTVYLFVPIIFFICKRQWIDRACGVAFLILLITAIASFCIAISAVIMVSMQCDYMIILYWLILLCDTAILALSITIITLNKVVFTSAFGTEKRKIITNTLEIKLKELKRLYENNVVTQNEYERMRESVISASVGNMEISVDSISCND